MFGMKFKIHRKTRLDKSCLRLLGFHFDVSDKYRWIIGYRCYLLIDEKSLVNGLFSLTCLAWISKAVE